MKVFQKCTYSLKCCQKYMSMPQAIWKRTHRIINKGLQCIQNVWLTPAISVQCLRHICLLHLYSSQPQGEGLLESKNYTNLFWNVLNDQHNCNSQPKALGVNFLHLLKVHNMHCLCLQHSRFDISHLKLSMNLYCSSSEGLNCYVTKVTYHPRHLPQPGSPWEKLLGLGQSSAITRQT